MELSLQYKLENTKEIALKILENLDTFKLILFYGEVGTGKTTLIKEICNQLKIKGEVSSPTFSLVNEYRTLLGEHIYHFDLYRIKIAEELEEIGFSEYLRSNKLCIIEWPEIAEYYFKDKQILKICLVHISTESRKITISN